MSTRTEVPARLSTESVNAFVDEVEQVADIGHRCGLDDVRASRFRILNSVAGETVGVEVTLRFTRQEYVARALKALGTLLGTTFTHEGERYTVVGYEVTSRNRPIVAERSDGERFDFSLHYVRDAK